MRGAVGPAGRSDEHAAYGERIDVSRITRGKIELRQEPVTLGSVITSAVEAAWPSLAAARHALKLSVPDEPIWLYVDPARVAQVVTNLSDPLAQRLFGHEKRTRDFRRGEAADQAQRERDASFHRKHGMARGEDEPQHVIIDHLIQRVLQGVSKELLLPLQLAGNLLMLLYEHAAAPQRIDRAPLGRLHQPCPGIVRDAFLGPDFEGRHERILRQFPGNAEIVRDASNRGDEACGLDLPHGLNSLGYFAHATTASAPGTASGAADSCLPDHQHHETHWVAPTAGSSKAQRPCSH